MAGGITLPNDASVALHEKLGRVCHDSDTAAEPAVGQSPSIPFV